VLFDTTFGAMAVVWDVGRRGPLIRRVFLSDAGVSAENRMRHIFPGTLPQSCPVVDHLVEHMRCFLRGEPVRFPRDLIALEDCPAFQKRVLLCERQVPRGFVCTYGRIARRLGMDRGARAVGSALARNPFPIVIPCHRTVRADGRLGGFQGGAAMKRALLELEGNLFGPEGRMLEPRFFH
jgi:methylated-DNA-[protein]-cysteine S-methyltransferase